MITTTLNRIRAHSPCKDGWEKLLKGLGKTKADDELLPFTRIFEINGLSDAFWCFRAEPQYERKYYLLILAFGRHVQHLMTYESSIKALDVVEIFANGKASKKELNAAMAPAMAAAKASARAAASDAAWVAVWVAAMAAASDAAMATLAALAAMAAARAAASDTASDAAYETELKWQKQEFIRICNETENLS